MCYDIMPIYNRLTQKNQGCKKIQKNQKENIKKHVVAGSDEDDEEEDGDHSNDFEASESSEMHLRRQVRYIKIFFFFCIFRAAPENNKYMLQ